MLSGLQPSQEAKFSYPSSRSQLKQPTWEEAQWSPPFHLQGPERDESLSRGLVICTAKQSGSSCGPSHHSPIIVGATISSSSKLLRQVISLLLGIKPPIWMASFSFLSLRILGKSPSMWGPLCQQPGSKMERCKFLIRMASWIPPAWPHWEVTEVSAEGILVQRGLPIQETEN